MVVLVMCTQSQIDTSGKRKRKKKKLQDLKKKKKNYDLSPLDAYYRLCAFVGGTGVCLSASQSMSTSPQKKSLLTSGRSSAFLPKLPSNWLSDRTGVL